MLARENSVREYEDQSYREKPRKNKQKKKKVVINTKVLTAGAIVASFIMATSVLYGYATITKMKMEISELESNRVSLESEKEYIISNLEEIKSTSKIEDKAIIKLGMDHPREDQIVYVDMEDSQKASKPEEKGIIQYIVGSVLSMF